MSKLTKIYVLLEKISVDVICISVVYRDVKCLAASTFAIVSKCEPRKDYYRCYNTWYYQKLTYQVKTKAS